MNKGLFGNRTLDKYVQGEIVFSADSPGRGFIKLDGLTKKLYERGVNKNFSVTMRDIGNLAWETRTSNFGNSTITSIAYGNSLWVAAGTGGNIRTSTDAISWVTRTSNFGASSINAVAYGNNLWVAGGAAGQIRTSTDAITWATQTSNFGVAFVNAALQTTGDSWLVAGSDGTLRAFDGKQIKIPYQSGYPYSGYTAYIKLGNVR